ncbi:MAG: hypothetical protein ACRDYV_07330, partial [Acidimicrobiia bacterium]
MGARVQRAAGGFGLATGMVLVMAGAAWAPQIDRFGPEGSQEAGDAYVKATCQRLLGQPATGGLGKETDPADGATVAAGDTVEVTLSWDPADWLGNALHKTVDCVTINDEFAPRLTVEDRPTTNDGDFTTGYTIPDGVEAGDEICDQGFMSGDSSGNGPGGIIGQVRSDRSCFTVGGAQERARSGV